MYIQSTSVSWTGQTDTAFCQSQFVMIVLLPIPGTSISNMDQGSHRTIIASYTVTAGDKFRCITIAELKLHANSHAFLWTDHNYPCHVHFAGHEDCYQMLSTRCVVCL